MHIIVVVVEHLLLLLVVNGFGFGRREVLSKKPLHLEQHFVGMDCLGEPSVDPPGFLGQRLRPKS